MKKWSLNLYQKFTLVIICVGLIPMSLLSTLIVNRMFKEYGDSLRANYEQATVYVNTGIDNMLEGYNGISKMPYYYNYSGEGDFAFNYMSFDNLRKIIYGIGYDPETVETARKQNMEIFLKNVHNVDSSIVGVHFLVDDGKMDMPFHFSQRKTYFESEEVFRERMKFGQLDKTSKQMMLIPTHAMDYYNHGTNQVFTVARNYFDLTKEVGSSAYIGTIYLDVDMERMAGLFQDVRLHEGDRVYVVNEQGDCFYSNDSEVIGTTLPAENGQFEETRQKFVIETPYGKHGLKVMMVMGTAAAYDKIQQMQKMMYLILAASIVALLLGSVLFSRRLTKPIRSMMDQMSQIETGNFKVELPVESNDEIGILSKRFNQMSQELETYINQSYVARMKQTEAEMTALKSQIYPHFLYNTLEVIRMTALDQEDRVVSEMIEALSQQIRYMIGPMQDMVPMDQEVDIIRKYVYLLNCRIRGKVSLMVELHGLGEVYVPKLILQPIVENAYVHGIKPKDGTGHVMIEAERVEDRLEISVMDNGVGMNEEALEKLKDILDGDEIGIKNQHNWQSIGLKNVHDRIRYLYGEQYGIAVTSTPAVGTMVRILIPWKEDGSCSK